MSASDWSRADGRALEPMSVTDSLAGQLTLFDEEADRTWCAYFAGLLDGEGYIGALNSLTPLVAIAMCEPDAVSAVYDRYRGHFSRRDGQRQTWRASYRWHVSGSLCVAPLRDALPFLRVKREQALIVLGIAPAVASRGYYGRAGLPELERQRRVRAYHKLRYLNRRGGAPPA
jgi:hypothetical protein